MPFHTESGPLRQSRGHTKPVRYPSVPLPKCLGQSRARCIRNGTLDECTNLRRLHYVSTCYVSGRHPGVFHGTDLDVGHPQRRASSARSASRSERSSAFRSSTGKIVQDPPEAEGTNATIRSGPPLPPAIFMGKATTNAPDSGTAPRLATFSKPGVSDEYRIRCVSKPADWP